MKLLWITTHFALIIPLLAIKNESRRLYVEYRKIYVGTPEYEKFIEKNGETIDLQHYLNFDEAIPYFRFKYCTLNPQTANPILLKTYLKTYRKKNSKTIPTPPPLPNEEKLSLNNEENFSSLFKE
ncbi:MAG: hypothetical protein WD068_00640 [Candidatus Babeliales bacterium]